MSHFGILSSVELNGNRGNRLYCFLYRTDQKNCKIVAGNLYLPVSIDRTVSKSASRATLETVLLMPYFAILQSKDNVIMSLLDHFVNNGGSNLNKKEVFLYVIKSFYLAYL
jgi:hypothetical protein